MQVKCDGCGGTINRPPSHLKRYKHHFHNKACESKWLSENIRGKNHPLYQSIDVKCDGCGIIFERKPSAIKKHGHNFHSKECYNKWLSKNQKSEKNSLRKSGSHVKSGKVKVKCDYCGKTIKIFRRDIKRNKYHFCNNKCRGKWISENRKGENHPDWQRVDIECDQCGVIFKQIVSKIKRNKHNFHNNKCKGEWESEHRKGENNYCWRGGSSFEPYGTEFNDELKDYIRWMDNYECQCCGYTEKQLGYKLSVHHIDYDKKNNSIRNLISLCKLCHGKTNFNRDDWINYFRIIIHLHLP